LICEEPEGTVFGKLLRQTFLQPEPREVIPVAQTVDLLWKAHKGDVDGEERCKIHNEAVFEAFKRGQATKLKQEEL